MISFFLRLAFFTRTLVRLWRRDPDFRTLLILVFFTLLSGTIFYSLQEGWSMMEYSRRLLLQRHYIDHRRLRRSRPDHDYR